MSKFQLELFFFSLLLFWLRGVDNASHLRGHENKWFTESLRLGQTWKMIQSNQTPTINTAHQPGSLRMTLFS